MIEDHNNGIQEPRPTDTMSQTMKQPEGDMKSEHLRKMIEDIQNVPDPEIRNMMMDTIQEVVNFYGQGLEQIFTTLSESGNAGAKNVYREMSEDPFLCGLMLIHDLHPLSLKERMEKALSSVRPYMKSHGGSVQVVSLEDGMAKLKFSGSCDGCPSSQITLELAIKQAINKHCPDIIDLQVEGIDESNQNSRNSASIFKTSLGWRQIPEAEHISEAQFKTLEVDDVPLVICRVKGEMYAFRNHCPGCDRTLQSGRLEGYVLSCRLGHSYDVQKAGKCVDDPEMHLSPYPLITENGSVRIALG